MNWEDRMQMAYEAQTDRMIDDMYAPRAIECSMCDEYFNEDNALETELCSKKVFCCESCLEDWEEEYGWEYKEEEGNQPAIQLVIKPAVQLPNHMAIHPTIYPANWTSNNPVTQAI